MQRAVVLRVGVTINQIKNEHLQNLLVFRVWIIWGSTKKLGGHCPRIPPRGYGPACVRNKSIAHSLRFSDWTCLHLLRYFQI